MELQLENLSVYAEKGYEVIITGEPKGVTIAVRREANGEKFGNYLRITRREMATKDISVVTLIEKLIAEADYCIEMYEAGNRIEV